MFREEIIDILNKSKPLRWDNEIYYFLYKINPDESLVKVDYNDIENMVNGIKEALSPYDIDEGELLLPYKIIVYEFFDNSLAIKEYDCTYKANNLNVIFDYVAMRRTKTYGADSIRLIYFDNLAVVTKMKNGRFISLPISMPIDYLPSNGYQKGFNYEYASRREAVLHRDNYTCQCCGKKHVRPEVHHIIFRSKGGTDDERNLITLCEKCHKMIHDGILVLTIKPKKSNLKYATYMSIIRSQLLKIYPDAVETFGFVTKENRNNLNLPKGHFIDACVIASGGEIFKQSNWLFKKKRVPRQNRQLCKGVRGEIKLPTGKVFGFRRFDKVKYLGKVCFIKARRTSGAFVLMDIDNNIIDFRDVGGRQNPSYKLLEILNTRRGTLCISQRI